MSGVLRGYIVKRGAILALIVLLLAISGVSAVSAQSNQHIQVHLHAVDNSGVSGIVDLRQRPHNDGTHINVVAFGLKPGENYVSLYYSNHVCKLEPYSVSDVIGGIYTANAGGVGTTEGKADDNLDKINSVSVRRAGDFKLLACANVHR